MKEDVFMILAIVFFVGGVVTILLTGNGDYLMASAIFAVISEFSSRESK